MTPAARISACIEILDRIQQGQPAEQVLTRWARGNRYAGSRDRAAIRDLVFDVLRKRRSCAAIGGGDSGRALMIGLLRQQGRDPEELFTGARHAPPPLSQAEKIARGAGGVARPVRLDYPDWLDDALAASLADDLEPVMECLRHRAPVFARVNWRKATLDTAITALAEDGIAGVSHPLARSALEIVENARAVGRSRAYRDGMIELQDAASQAVVEFLDIPQDGRILDYCAGGGGKSLAMAALTEAEILAHDAAPRRMHDLPLRAARAGVRIATVSDPARAGDYGLVLVDAPCSGSGAWRRSPAGKWALTAERLAELVDLQARILDEAAPLVAPGGVLAYVTCSILRVENQTQIAAFVGRNSGFELVRERQFTPLDGGDGLFVAICKRI
ncbi:MAG: RsmB/NOP family class I SAM-dependent RNA methyltransferase [Paracoccaceae bacterium]|nr:RsmB/NOP family class I SAM-dependent RNA methyltransferase [Paracoccaceae bacterium]